MASSVESNTYSSDDEVLRPVVKRKKKTKAIVSSDTEDDSDFEIKHKKVIKPLKCESDEESNSVLNNGENSCSSSSKNYSETINDVSSGEDVDKCAICLSKFHGQDIATPETCDHVFCLECLQEWAKNVNTCPIDRLKFNLILIRHYKGEKIIRTITVNNCAHQSHSDSEAESVTLSSATYCELCDEDKNEGFLLRCPECSKYYHYHCILPALQGSSSFVWSCEGHFWGRYSRVSVPLPYRLTDSFRNRRQQYELRRDELPGINYELARFATSSDSSDEEVTRTPFPVRSENSRISAANKARCALFGARRSSIFRARNRALVSATASSPSESRLYVNDTDEDEYRVPSPSVPENYDVVGTILESQTLLHKPDVLTLSRDGTLLRNAKAGTHPRLSSSPASSSLEENSHSPLPSPSYISEKVQLPLPGKTNAKQQPMNPSQNSSSNYTETPMQAYACSSGSCVERSVSYDNNTATPVLNANSNDRFGNDPCSHAPQKNFCGSQASENAKKDGRHSKAHHSEEEVDIYSDIESVGDEDSLTNDRVEAMKIAYKCEDSQLSNPNESSDSSDNELVIDEDHQIEEEHQDKVKDNQERTGSSIKESTVCKSEDSNISSNGASDDENDQLMIDTSHETSGRVDVDNSQDACSNPGDESSQGLPQNDESNLSKSSLPQHEESNLSKCSQDFVQNEESNQSNLSQELTQHEESNQSRLSEVENEDSSQSKLSQVLIENEESNHSKLSQGLIENESSQSKLSQGLIENGDSSHSKFSEASIENESNQSKSSQGLLHCNDTNPLRLGVEDEKEKNESEESDIDVQESDVEMQDNENSMDSTKKSCQGEPTTPCTSVKSSPKSQRGETADGFQMDCDNSASNENVYCDNSMSDRENDVSFSSSQIGELKEFNKIHSNSIRTSQTENNMHFHSENNSNFDFPSHHRNHDESGDDSNAQHLCESSTKETELIDICKNISINDDDNEDSIENASTPCQDENLDDQLDNSPLQDENAEDEDQDFDSAIQGEFEEKEESKSEGLQEESKTDNAESMEQEEISDKEQENTVDLGIEDISDTGTGDEYPEKGHSLNGTEIDDVEEKVARLFGPDQINEDDGNVELSKNSPDDYDKHASQSNLSSEDHEEGEIIEEKPVHRCKKKKERVREDVGDYGEFAPRVNISDLPRIPKLKRDRDKDKTVEASQPESKRTSVLSRVDLGGVDISWKRLSKHTRERSYRDGRPKDEKLLYRERESRNKEKTSGSSRKNDKRSAERRRDDKKADSEKSKCDHDSRSRKSDRSYSERDRDKRKSRKDKYSKDKHAKDKKDKHDTKSKYSKDDKYDRNRQKEDSRHERDSRSEKGNRHERSTYEKSKTKDKDHKSKHKDRKSESTKSSKDHSRDKRKHTHSGDRFSDKQREREVRKIDDKLKIVVEQKENRKEKSKHKERKETKHEKKQIVQRKIESERSPYTEVTSIESKEIFAKGDSIIINVNFNRAPSPKVALVSNDSDTNSKDRKSAPETVEQQDEQVSPEDFKNKSKQASGEKLKDSSSLKRPSTPPEKNLPVKSVSECYWQGGDDPDSDHSQPSEKSVEEMDAEHGNESAAAYEVDIFSSSSSSRSSPEVVAVQSMSKDGSSPVDDPVKENDISKESEDFGSKRRSPRSPSPPSPADNDSYDPCEPTRSPSPPPPMPPAPPPPLPTTNPKPPPSPELPPLPPEPEPVDGREDCRVSSAPSSVPTSLKSSVSQPNTVHTQTASPVSVPSILLPPPAFLSHVTTATSSMPGLPSMVAARGANFQMGAHGPMMLPANHVMANNFMPPPPHMHGGSTLPPPPTPPNLPHMSSVPPPPPPPAGMSLLPQPPRLPRLNVQPPLTPSSLLQSLTMGHAVSAPPMQLIHHLPPNLSGILTNHQSPAVCTSQNQTSLPVGMANQQNARLPAFPHNPIPNHNLLLQNQTAISDSNKTQCAAALAPGGSSLQRNARHSPTVERNEVIDMEVDTPYSPGDCSADSAADYSPTSSPVANSPKSRDAFDSLLPSEQRSSDKRTYDAATDNEKSKHHGSFKKSKHEHKLDSKTLKMQTKEKHKKLRKEKGFFEKRDSISKFEDSQLKILDELPSSAVEMQVKEKFLKKLNRQERVVEEVKMVLKPFYKTRDVTKEEYKDILRRAVPKICHNKSGEINPVKVKHLVECYVRKARHSKKKGKRSSKFS